MEIYAVTNLKNGKKYVGQTLYTKEKRWYDHVVSANSCRRPFYRDIIKHGAQNFRIETLARVDDPDLLDGLERYFISLFQTQDRSKGYNTSAGGYGPRRTRRKGVHRDSLTLKERLRQR